MKQRSLRKLVSMILAVVMVLSMSAAAFAATSTEDTTGTITISNAVVGQTYTIYQLATVTYDTTNEAYTYTPVSDWSDFLSSTDAAAYVTVTSGGYLTWSGENSAASYAAFAQLAQEYAETNGITAADSATASETTVTFSNLSLGWYLVDTSLGALCDLTTTAPDAEIEEKNGTPGADKKIVEEDESKVTSNTANIGDVISYQITVTDVKGASDLKLHDTLGSGLTLNASTITVTYYSSADDTGTTLTEDDEYTLTDTDQSFTIDFTKYAGTLISADSGAYIVVEYTATVNSSAIIGSGGNINTTYVEYGDGTYSTEKTTATYVYSFKINKTDSEGAYLSGAEFTLSDSEGTIKFTADDPVTTYKRDDTSGSATITAGNVTISGLAAGTYTLKETKAPDGYNLLTYDITVTIDGEGNVTFKNATTGAELSADGTDTSLLNIENVKGSILPSTGGMGTTIFYIAGGVLVLGAAVLFVTRKRLGSEN